MYLFEFNRDTNAGLFVVQITHGEKIYGNRTKRGKDADININLVYIFFRLAVS